MDKSQLEEVLSSAIASELEANRFYAEVAARAVNPAVKQAFAELAAEELGHRDLLEAARRDPGLLGRMSGPGADYRVAEATALPPLMIDMKPADAIALAMKKEQEAFELYSALAAKASDPALAEVLIGLAKMEQGHKARLEGIFVQIGYPEVF